MTDVDQITQIVIKWADRCAGLYRLKPSKREFQKDTRKRFPVVIRDRVPPTRLEKLKEQNLKLYERLRTS